MKKLLNKLIYKLIPNTLKWAVLANCHRCMGYYSDGKTDCLGENTCPLYDWYPYRPKDKTGKYLKTSNQEWRKYNPKKIGLNLNYTTQEQIDRGKQLSSNFRNKGNQ